MWPLCAFIQVREHLLAGVQHGGPVPVGLQQHGNGAHLQVGDPEGEICVSGSFLGDSLRSRPSLTVGLFASRPAEEPTTWGGYLGKVLMASTTYLPSQVTEMFTQGRAFATVRLPFCGHKNICALAV